MCLFEVPWKTPDYRVADTRVLLPTLLQVRLGLALLLPLWKAFGVKDSSLPGSPHSSLAEV